MVNDCRRCEHYESICDGYGLCMRDAIGVIVLSDYEKTKNFMHCKNKNQSDNRYGEMAYQKEEQ